MICLVICYAVSCLLGLANGGPNPLNLRNQPGFEDCGKIKEVTYFNRRGRIF
jgi:hypothetical protein